MTAREIERELKELGDPEDARFLQGYFKTGPGQYGEGDRFLGIRAPVLRALARRHDGLSLRACRSLLHSRYHEARLLALLILVRKYEHGDGALRDAVHRLYLDNTERVNNWDLVGVSAPRIVGGWLEDRDRSELERLARSGSVWERRIAVLATLRFIQRGEFEHTFRVADILLADRHDLIHKAVGWMLREVGKRDRAAEEAFLATRYRRMPRTMLRYAIEKFPTTLRERYLRGEVTAAPPAVAGERVDAHGLRAGAGGS
jgi:3-methyladenine DNA glycosylase AlkD